METVEETLYEYKHYACQLFDSATVWPESRPLGWTPTIAKYVDGELIDACVGWASNADKSLAGHKVFATQAEALAAAKGRRNYFYDAIRKVGGVVEKDGEVVFHDKPHLY